MVPVGPVIAYYGTYSPDGNTLNYHVRGAPYPNFEGTDQKGIITVKGDTLTSMRTITGGAEPFTSTVEWKRVK
jgi:Lipocalin-like domain